MSSATICGSCLGNVLGDPTLTVSVDRQGRRTVVGINLEISLKSLIESVNLVCQDLLSVQSEDRVEQLKRRKKAFEYSNRVIELYEKSEKSRGFLERTIYRIIRLFADRKFYTVFEKCKKYLDDSRSFEELGHAFPFSEIYMKTTHSSGKALHQIPRELFLQVISKAINIETKIKYLEKKISSLESKRREQGKDLDDQESVVETESYNVMKFLESGNLTVNVNWLGDRIVSNGQHKMALKTLIESVNQAYQDAIPDGNCEDQMIICLARVIDLYETSETSRSFMGRIVYRIVRIFVDRKLHADLRQCRKNLETVGIIAVDTDYDDEEFNVVDLFPFKLEKILSFDGCDYFRMPKEIALLGEHKVERLKNRLRKLENRFSVSEDDLVEMSYGVFKQLLDKADRLDAIENRGRDIVKCCVSSN